MRKTMISRVLAGAATMTLALGVAACAETDEAVDSAGDAANEATSAVGDAVAGDGEDADGTDGADDADSADSTDGADDADGADGADGSDSTDDANGADGANGDSADGANGANGDSAEGDAANDGETTEVQTADGNSVLVPGDFASELSDVEGEWGQPASVQESDGSFVAEFENGDRMIYSEETGSVPLVGMIGQTWSDEGGLGSEVGLPVSPEEEVDGGWTQEFQNGQISWTFDGEQFSGTVE